MTVRVDKDEVRTLCFKTGNQAAGASNAEDQAIEDGDVELASAYATAYGLLVSARFALDQAAGVLDVAAKNRARKLVERA